MNHGFCVIDKNSKIDSQNFLNSAIEMSRSFQIKIVFLKRIQIKTKETNLK